MPLSRRWTPLRHLISVDLPAPLSPSSASTSPRRRSRSIPSSAPTAPKRLVAPRTASTGIVSHRRVAGGRAHACLVACSDPHAALDVAAEHVGLDGQEHDDADRHQLVEGIDVVQVERVADHADRERPDERVADVAAAAGERGAADDHGRDRVELGEVAGRRRAGVDQPGREQAGDAGGEPAQDVDRDEHAARRDARAPRRLGIPADGVQPAAPHEPRRQQQADERERRSTTKIEYGIQSIEPPPIVCTIGGMPGISVPFAAHSARPLTMLSVASVTMNGCGTRP